ncbi:uncharacterized protein BO95DRAFT_438380 [Aspergillus brunneoviolaceus CBS 621.78]|uniref:Uncharacterized protein n=1 Tax=Aspergillus brunneoviolaceus CBS 621.78 TaxID=1450534 RepID=A0ACD1GML6_9EURO|nr:hypothetical protein BO95DRAFT_438380 [Aspergillus brunneoviolaceus CBS 621.78]RAH50580.1 hypothetical protein BO95DRAFT_438380 [Aspergillus brunneoviolaceus CBS 621.78]
MTLAWAGSIVKSFRSMPSDPMAPNPEKVASKVGYFLGTPKCSPDGKRTFFYETTREGTWEARETAEVEEAADG